MPVNAGPKSYTALSFYTLDALSGHLLHRLGEHTGLRPVLLGGWRRLPSSRHSTVGGRIIFQYSLLL
jgi:hypothetical protein